MFPCNDGEGWEGIPSKVCKVRDEDIVFGLFSRWLGM